jgi:hypothetical protein
VSGAAASPPHHVLRPSVRTSEVDWRVRQGLFHPKTRTFGRTDVRQTYGDWGSWPMFEARRCAPYSAGALAGSAIDSCGCAAAVCEAVGAGAGPPAPVCTGRTPGSLRKASHCSFVP